MGPTRVLSWYLSCVHCWPAAAFNTGHHHSEERTPASASPPMHWWFLLAYHYCPLESQLLHLPDGRHILLLAALQRPLGLAGNDSTFGSWISEYISVVQPSLRLLRPSAVRLFAMPARVSFFMLQRCRATTCSTLRRFTFYLLQSPQLYLVLPNTMWRPALLRLPYTLCPGMFCPLLAPSITV